MTPSHPVARAVELIRQAKHVVALTGAGISTPSGIPDFRSPDSGVWDKADPMEVASIYAFRNNPGVFFEWIRPLTDTIFNARPNAAHLPSLHWRQTAVCKPPSPKISTCFTLKQALRPSMSFMAACGAPLARAATLSLIACPYGSNTPATVGFRRVPTVVTS